MDLKRKLDRLGGLGPRMVPPVAQEKNAPAIHGPLCRTRLRFEPGHCHGGVRADEALSISPDSLALLAFDAQVANCATEKMLFLDTETTGLAGGTGTLPFLIGTGWFENGALHLEQCVLRQPGEERPMLERLHEQLSAASLIVTFNGKAYDWPLLRTRFVMNRMPVPTLPPHVDLLHASRRVLKRRLSSVRLVEVEAGALGHRRVGDIEGARIPELYFRFLRHRRLAALEPVLEHNGHDLVALAALMGWLGRGLEGDARDARDSLGLCELARRGRDFERALRFASTAAQSPQARLASEALSQVAWLSRRAGNASSAAAALRRALSLGENPRLHLELAKLYEHRLRDVGQALLHARHAGEAEPRLEHQRRVVRLERKSDARGRQLSVL